MEVVFLDEMPEAIEALAPAFWAEWGERDGLTLEDVRRRVAACMQRDRLPLALVVREGSRVMGTVSLLDRPVVGREGLGPWLGALWVQPGQRGRGLGRTLIAAAARTAADLGIGELYALTSTAVQLFRAAGWSEVERIEDQREELTLFRWTLPRGS